MAESAVKRRNPIERILVQGGIVILLLVLGVELRAQKGYTTSLNSLKETSDHDDGGKPLSEVEPMLILGPSKTQISQNKVEATWEYSWFSFFKNGQYRIRLVTSIGEPVEMVRYYTGTEDTMMDVRERPPEEVHKLPPGGLGFGTAGGGGPPANEPDDKAEEKPAESPESSAETPAATEPPAEPTETPSEPAPALPETIAPGGSRPESSDPPADPPAKSEDSPSGNPGA